MHNVNNVNANVSETTGNKLITQNQSTKNGESTLSTTITSDNMETQCEVVITPDRDKNSAESKTMGNLRIKQNTMKKNGRTCTSITIQCNEERIKKSKIDATHDYLHYWNSTDAMELFVPPNTKTIADALQYSL